MILGELDSQVPIKVTAVGEIILLLQSREKLLIELFIVGTAGSVINVETYKQRADFSVLDSSEPEQSLVNARGFES